MMRIVNKSIIYIGAFIFSFSIFSCNKSLEEEKGYTEDKNIENYLRNKTYEKVDGVYHYTTTPSYGYQVAKGDTITFWFKGYTLKGDVFETNIKTEAVTAKLDTNSRSFDPVETIAGEGKLVKGLDVGMLQIHEGESATILFKSSLGFGNDAIGPVEEWTSLIYDINLISVSNSSIRKEKNYINGLGLEGSGYKKDISGLYYKELLLGSGILPAINDTIYGWYRGTLPDGSVIDESGEGSSQIVLSNINLPIGVRLGFTLTSVEGNTSLVIPSFLGYGNNGKVNVEPYQTLFYQIRLDSIK